MTKAQTIHLIGFPMDLGAGRRGVDMGPSALRIADIQERLELLGYTVHDEGDIQVKTQEMQKVENEKLKYLSEITRASNKLADRVKDVLNKGAFPLVLGGDHAMSVGSLAGVGAHCQEHHKRLGVVWIDAHPDMNTADTTPSGNIHGMPLAVAMGYGVDELVNIGGAFPKVSPEHVAIIGARDIDPGEAQLIKQLKIPTYTMYEVDKIGIYQIVEEIMTQMRKNSIDHLHVSFDVDGVDPFVAPGVGTPVLGGLSYREAHFIMETLAETGMVSSLDVAEVNPILDNKNQTALFAAGIVSSCMGKRIM